MWKKCVQVSRHPSGALPLRHPSDTLQGPKVPQGPKAPTRSQGPPKVPRSQGPTRPLQGPTRPLQGPGAFKVLTILNTIKKQSTMVKNHFFNVVNMPYTQRRHCPKCGKQDLLKLSEHLRQVHGLSSEERQPLLKSAVLSQVPLVVQDGSYPTALSMESPECTRRPPWTQTNGPLNTVNCLVTQPYPDFKFIHPAMIMIVGPTLSGKSYFVEQLLNSTSIKYPSRTARRIHIFYTQWQSLYDRLQATHGTSIAFTQGLPEVNDNLDNIDDRVHNVWVLDDLMDEAVQSPVISRLFTRGRHRNLSVLLLLQNMFPKGKYNTDISRNAIYKVLFRSPGDRKQIDIMAEQTFAKDRANFMKAYTQETEKPYGYIILDNHPRTTSDRQVVADVFGQCKSYPHISTPSTKPHAPPVLQSFVTGSDDAYFPKTPLTRPVELSEAPRPPQKRKAGSSLPTITTSKPSAVKQSTKSRKKDLARWVNFTTGKHEFKKKKT